MLAISVWLLLVAVTTVVIWKESATFERSAARLSGYCGLPVAVHGAIVVAVGSLSGAEFDRHRGRDQPPRRVRQRPRCPQR